MVRSHPRNNSKDPPSGARGLISTAGACWPNQTRKDETAQEKQSAGEEVPQFPKEGETSLRGERVPDKPWAGRLQADLLQMLERYAPTTVCQIPAHAIVWNARTTFLNLPNEIFRLFFEYLDLPDRASLALTCKPIALKLDFWGLLAWDEEEVARLETPVYDPVAELLKGRLGKGWFPAHLKYCCKCGKYLPLSKRHWRNTLRDEFFLRGGNVGQKYRRWIARADEDPSAETILDSECLNWSRPKPQTCPRCRLLS